MNIGQPQKIVRVEPDAYPAPVGVPIPTETVPDLVPVER